MLLLHGAHADRADKHGVTPQKLATANGKSSTAVLRAWLENKDSDLRERERCDGGGMGDESGNGGGTIGNGHGYGEDRKASCGDL
jgi:hypothetical protein